MNLHWLRSRDPDLLALRRGTRVAVAVPISMLLLNQVPAVGESTLFGVFACLSLLTFANFGGALAHRASAYIGTIIGAIPILMLGSAVGETVVRGGVMMALIATVVGLLAVLRGSLAAAQKVLLLSAVLALTSAQSSQMAQVVGAWLIGGAVATVAAVVLWPARPYLPIAQGLGTVYRQCAAATRQRWADTGSHDYQQTAQEARTHLHAVHKSFDGNLQRPAGLTSPDRTLSARVQIAERLCQCQEWVDVTPADADPQPDLAAANRRFATIVANELDHIGTAMESQTETASHPERIRVARDEHLTAVSRWVQHQRKKSDVSELQHHLDDTFPLRLTAIATELASIGGDDKFSDPLLGSLAEFPQRGVLQRVSLHLSWDSPWLRLAIRTGVALGVSVAIANALSLQHSFWIVLGTLVALRFDASGTGRNAMQALVGTTAGALVGAGLVALVGDNQVLWAVLLPISLFLAAYTPSTFSLGTGQAAFSLAVITLFSLLYPATLQTAEVRFIDVAIGLAVSLTISALIWPRGVVAILQKRCVAALTTSTDYLMLAMDHVAGGAVDRQMLHTGRDQCLKQLDRARETFDLTVSQRPPQDFPLRRWAGVVSAAQQCDISAHLITSAGRTVSDRGGPATVPTTVAGPFLHAAAALGSNLRRTADQAQAMPTTRTEPKGSAAETSPLHPSVLPDLHEGAGPQMSTEVTRLREAVTEWLSHPDDWPGAPPDPRPAMLSWLSDQAAFVDWTAWQLRHSLDRGPSARG